MSKKVIIIGGGISGLCSAYYLLKEGCSVTIIDKGNFTTGASFINAGYLTPSHFISFASPGVITQGLKWMFDKSSPLYIKPRLDFDFLKWVLLFKKSATAYNLEKNIPIIKDLNLKSQKLYEELLASLDFSFHYEKKGVLMAFKSAEAKEEEYTIAERAIKEGLSVKTLNKSELHKLEPVFSDEVIGAVHYKCDSHTTPNQFMSSMKTWLQSHGVIFILNQKITGFEIKSNNIISVKTPTSIFEADEFVLASGSWTSNLALKLNLNIPIQGGKGYSLDVNRATGITIPAILVEAKTAITPMQNFTRFAGTMEFSGNNTVIRNERVNAISKAVKSYYSTLEITDSEKAKATSGLRPMSPDGLPFIGKTNRYNNLTIAAGHAMMGWSLGPITGKLVSEVITKRKKSVELYPFCPDRFK